jgi:hypothetical protein
VITSPLRPQDRQDRASLPKAISPTRGTSYGASLPFTTTTHHGFLQTRPHGSPAALNRRHRAHPGEVRPRPLPLQCWVPLSEPLVRTHTPISYVMACVTTTSASGLGVVAAPPRAVSTCRHQSLRPATLRTAICSDVCWNSHRRGGGNASRRSHQIAITSIKQHFVTAHRL